MSNENYGSDIDYKREQEEEFEEEFEEETEIISSLYNIKSSNGEPDTIPDEIKGEDGFDIFNDQADSAQKIATNAKTDEESSSFFRRIEDILRELASVSKAALFKAGNFASRYLREAKGIMISGKDLIFKLVNTIETVLIKIYNKLNIFAEKALNVMQSPLAQFVIKVITSITRVLSADSSGNGWETY